MGDVHFSLKNETPSFLVTLKQRVACFRSQVSLILLCRIMLILPEAFAQMCWRTSLIENSGEYSFLFIKNNLLILNVHSNAFCNEESNFVRNALEDMTNVFEHSQKKVGKGNKKLEDGIITFCKLFCWLNEKKLICFLHSFDGAFVFKV